LSLRSRLLLAVGAVAIVALTVADVATYSALRSFLYQRVDQSLDGAHLDVERALDGHGPPGERAVATLAPGTYVEVRDVSGNVVATTKGHIGGGEQVVPKLPARIDGFQDTNGPGEPNRYLTVGSVEGSSTFRARASLLRGGGTLVLALPLVGVELVVTVAGLLAAVLLGWWLVKVGLRPLADVEVTAGAIAEGDLERRVPGAEANTEVGRLARVLNTMLGRIQAAFAARDTTEAELRRSEARLRRFVADASHELRTPLAAVTAYAELFERGANERPEDLARVMTGIRTEAGRMAELVDDLLLLARLDEGRPLEREPVELVALAAQAVDAASTVGPAWPVRLEAAGPAEVLGDATRLRQVLDNLLANVRAHTPEGTSAVVRIGAEAASAVVTVTDDGPGLDPEQMRMVFERFYRVDPSRSRQHGGAGLGLAIVAAIVGAHGGEVSAAVAPGGGAVFTVRLPLADSADETAPVTAAPGRAQPLPAPVVPGR
jgi:two-component system OmpR family sensor kinase